MDRQPKEKKWVSKKEWIANLTSKKTVDSDMADVTSSNGSSGNRNWKKNNNFSQSEGWSANASEEEDKQALYDIIHNMVDRIMEKKESESENPRKKLKTEEVKF